jgi:hypothetical protein
VDETRPATKLPLPLIDALAAGDVKLGDVHPAAARPRTSQRMLGDDYRERLEA